MFIANICRRKGGSSVCYKSGGDGRVIHKEDSSLWRNIICRWGSDGRDLDICGYWLDAESMKIGYGYHTANDILRSDAYRIKYLSGDKTEEDTQEEMNVRIVPWDANTNHTFRIHFNYFGADESHPADICEVIVPYDVFTIARYPHCSTDRGRAANINDPGCDVVFDYDGGVVDIYTFG